ncbi:MAG TPA: N-acetyltransferase [Thermodesulfovibrionales bacterium]|nr:N-acetyltransferase [Thermodesulfovibrionales bacterium]
MPVRKAKISDVKAIHRLVNEFAKKGEMIPRSLNDLYENIRDIFVYEDRGEIKGVCALHILWEDLAEIRSLSVCLDVQGIGIGKKLVTTCIKEAKQLGIKRLFALTYHPEFFGKIGFCIIDKSKLPQKIWGECLRCPKFPECDESAVIMNLS